MTPNETVLRDWLAQQQAIREQQEIQRLQDIENVKVIKEWQLSQKGRRDPEQELLDQRRRALVAGRADADGVKRGLNLSQIPENGGRHQALNQRLKSLTGPMYPDGRMTRPSDISGGPGLLRDSPAPRDIPRPQFRNSIPSGGHRQKDGRVTTPESFRLQPISFNFGDTIRGLGSGAIDAVQGLFSSTPNRPANVDQGNMDFVYDTIDKLLPAGLDANGQPDGRAGQFMREIAKAESWEGLHGDTVRENYRGGVFQVDKGTFNDIQRRALVPDSHYAKKRTKIIDQLGVDISYVQWDDLADNPLLSGLFGRLKLTPVAEEIPRTVGERAQYWKDNYNSRHRNATGTPQKYLDAQRQGFARDPMVQQPPMQPMQSLSAQDLFNRQFQQDVQPTPPMQMMEPKMQMAPQPIQEPAYGRSGGIYSPQQMRQMSLYSQSLANKQGLGLGNQ